MARRSTSTSRRGSSLVLIGALLVLWQLVSMAGIVPSFMLPSPMAVLRAFWGDLRVLCMHIGVTLLEALLGLGLGIGAAFLLAVLMDRSDFMYRALYPVLMLTQTVPTVAIAPLLVLWMGYDITPKVTLVFLVCFFPVTVGLLDGFREADPDAVMLLRSMGARELQIFRHLKLPGALPRFFSSLRIAASYALVGAVIAEWLGGSAGLGVYMTRVRKSYAFDKMFAVIFLTSALSLLLMRAVKWTERAAMPWTRRD